ncbi:MAG: DUF4417 domain-containing protein [Erysipelotrichaceae bacterium]|nr:DUF4417 domain-containing protein [Erysipelotrichaceae bacterium]
MKINKKSIIDDGCTPELVRGCHFDGYLDIPIIQKPKILDIPKGLIPFSIAKKNICHFDEYVCFYEMDEKFSDVLRNPANYIELFKKV